MAETSNIIDSNNASALIEEQVANYLVQPLEAASIVLAAGPRIFQSSEPLRIPKLVSGPDANWVGQGQKIPETGAEFGEIELMPTNRASVKTMTPVSNEMVRMAKMGVTQVLQDSIVKTVASSVDTALLKGNGTGDPETGVQPTGLLQQAGQTGTFDPSDPDSLLDLLAQAASLEVTPNRWFMSGDDFYDLRKAKDGNGTYLLQPEGDITEGVKFRLFGVPVVTTNKLAKGEGLLVDMNQVAVVRDVDPQVKVLDQFYGDIDSIAIRCVSRFDIGLLNPDAAIAFEAGAAA